MTKKYLIRSGIAPTEIRSPESLILNPSIGGNIGNLIYAFSVYRNLMTEDVEFVPDRYRINENDAEMINATYDAYIIPLADAFRDSFVSSLKAYTKLFNELTIPVVVIGVGLRAPFEPDLKKGFPYDKEVKDFVRAVLNHSSMIGVRGQITADYLTSLGFKEGVDHMVIGCPSMYSFGDTLQIRDTKVDADSMIALNGSKHSPDNVLKFTERIAEDYPNYYYIPQWQKELKMTYLGNEILKKTTNYYPIDISHKFYQEGRVRFPVNAKAWIDFVSQADLAVGSRLHGNITATIAGTPSLLIPKDARMRELTDYHHLTHIWAKEITDETRLSDLIEKVDFHAPEKVQNENFDRFIKFLDQNGLDHIQHHAGISILDQQLEALELPEMVQPINCLEPSLVAKRLSLHEAKRTARIRELKKENTELISGKQTLNKEKSTLQNKQQLQKIELLEKQVTQLENTLNRKAPRIALKIADFFSHK